MAAAAMDGERPPLNVTVPSQGNDSRQATACADTASPSTILCMILRILSLIGAAPRSSFMASSLRRQAFAAV